VHQLAFAWLATALFAVSLGYFLYAYLFTFGVTTVTAAGGGWSAALINLALFTGFAVHHSLFARTRFKRMVSAAVSPALERAVYTVVASLLFLLVCMCWRHVPGVLYAVPAPWRWAGYAVQVSGIWLTFAASRALDVFDLSGVRQAAVQHGSTRGPGLITSGVFGIVRHPLYFGWALFVFGTPDMTLTRLTFAVISTAYLALAIPFEERSLVETFGVQYESYRRQVRWRMVPFLY
jgi:protein-S-isoprenylcysteine O-methyltransferase Ste14